MLFKIISVINIFVGTFLLFYFYKCLYLPAQAIKKILAYLETKKLNVMLDEEDLRCLLRGDILKIVQALSGQEIGQIALSDIGFDRIGLALDDAEAQKDTYKNHIKEI